MALEVQDIRQAIDEALKHKVLECVINGDSPSDPFSELAKVQTIRMVTSRISDKAIDDALVALFMEARSKFDPYDQDPQPAP